MEQLKDLPIIITKKEDLHTDESDVEASVSKRASTIAQTFDTDQMMILHLLLKQGNIDPILFRLFTKLGGSGYFVRSYSGLLWLKCEDVWDKEHTLIEKSTDQLAVFQRWEKPAAWIELSDLKMGIIR